MKKVLLSRLHDDVGVRVGEAAVNFLDLRGRHIDGLPFVSTYYPEIRLNRRMSNFSTLNSLAIGGDRMYIGLDVHKRLVYITEMENDGNLREQYEIKNSEESWNEFKSRYQDLKPEIALETSTTGKYVARLLRDMGFSVHLADLLKLPLIFKASKKNDKEDSYKLAKLLRLGELPEILLPSKESDELRSLIRYRKSLGKDMTRIKNKIHALLARYGVSINATDIFGRRGIKEMEKLSAKIGEADNTVLSDMIKRITELKECESKIEDEISRIASKRKDVTLLLTIPGIDVYSGASCIKNR